MPRNSAPHFKLLLTLGNHRKTLGVVGDDAILAMYVRAGMKAIERYADRTDDRFWLTDADLIWIAGTQPVANARKKLLRMVAATPLELGCACAGRPLDERCDCAGYRLDFPNFAKKQFPRRSDGTSREGSASATASASTKEPPKSPPKGDALADLWERIQAAFREHGKQGDRLKLTDDRRRKLRARLREHEPDELVNAVHGYQAMHRKPGNDFDPARNFDPDTIFGVKCAKYIEAFNEQKTKGPSWKTKQAELEAINEERKGLDPRLLL